MLCVPLTALKFVGGRLVFPATVGGVKCGEGDPLGKYLARLAKTKQIVPGRKVEPAKAPGP